MSVMWKHPWLSIPASWDSKSLRGSPTEAYVVLGGTTGGEHIILIPTPDSEATGLHHAGFELWNDAEIDESKRKFARIRLEH